MINKIKIFKIFLLLALSGVLLAGPSPAKQPLEKKLADAIGSNDSILIKNAQTGDILISKNTAKPLIPASIIKVVTSLAAIHYLGEDYRFPTECYKRKDGSLVLKGFGDPFFVSEEIDLMAMAVSRVVKRTPHVIVDYSYFDTPDDLPGRTPDTLQPYDAPSGALCANFNTVAFTRKKGQFISAESQTPLLPFAIDRIKSSGFIQGRIMMIQNQQEAALYAGELFSHFLAAHGCRVRGSVLDGRIDSKADRLAYRHFSQRTLQELVSQLLHFSSNLTANQLMLCCGAEKFGPPATHSKGLRAVQSFLRQELGTQCIKLAEGAGLSRDTRVSAETMSRVLDAFAPYLELMRKKGDNEYYKTGNLNNVSTRVGYIRTNAGGRFQYVVMLNSPEKDAECLMPMVRKLIRQVNK